MKKNTMMRIASVLMVAVLLSTCAISGTFAKYVTAATGSDQARVAKWGITMSNNGSATFKDKYDSSEPYSVKSDGSGNITDVVAPGTSGGTTYEVDGKPEVDYVITFEYENVKDVFLGAGSYTYPDYYVGMDTNLTEIYYPIKYTIEIITTGSVGLAERGDSEAFYFNDNAKTKEFDTLADAMAALKNTQIQYKATDEECDLVITLSWVWEFNGQNDKADTILGDLAANNIITQNDYSLDITYTLTMTATQVD